MEDWTRGLIAVVITLCIFIMGIHRGRKNAVEDSLGALIKMKLLKVTKDGRIVRGDDLDLE
tara:strand:- start:6539 stop:6721 length:183 start_codon:yes stop_codon:yes gene_type:complete